MMSAPDPAAFDQYAGEYDRALQQGLSVSGEDKTYFALGRVRWLAKCLKQAGFSASSILDFGCGTGSATPYFQEVLQPKEITGTDLSAKSLALARQQHGSATTRFVLLAEYQPPGTFDLAFCNGVFHHIPLAERARAVRCVWQSLRPGGLFAFWENNPWNPGTRYVMSRIPFDRDAITLSVREAKRLLQAGGFEVVRADFMFIFPKFLGLFRGLEPMLSSLPFGAQYQLLCRKPG